MSASSSKRGGAAPQKWEETTLPLPDVDVPPITTAGSGTSPEARAEAEQRTARRTSRALWLWLAICLSTIGWALWAGIH